MTLERVRGLIDAGGRPPIGDTLGFQLVDAGDGWAAFEGVPGREHYNPQGTVHGGYAATLLDSACGIAVVTKLDDKQSMTTLELKTSYLKAMNETTGKVRAEGRVISIGRRVAYTEAKLSDETGRLLATATSTLLVITP
ncbi:PaaI family thioesterase [Sphingopyxis sp.]|uniref:PaaI family thioesterase n=1 Tax=Sphingopyxis sp. TaxID=1908224 RepID=UPI003D12C2F6